MAIALLTPAAAILAMRGRIDPRWQIFAGFAMLGVSNWMLAGVTTSQTSFWTLGPALILSGLGLSQIFVPLSLAVLGAVPPKDVPSASAFFNLARQVGGSIATAILVTVLVRGVTYHQADLGSDVTLHAQVVQQFLQVHGGERSVAALQNLANFVTQQAYILSYADTARLTAIITFVLAPLVILMRRPRTGGISVTE